MRRTERELLDLVAALNTRLVALERRAKAKSVTAADEAQVDNALEALGALADAYIDADASERALIRRRAGFDPDARLRFRDVIRRRLTWFPKRRGDYRDALWFVALAYAAEAQRGLSDRRLRLALAALCIEGGRRDDRDTLDTLHRLHRSAREAGLDPDGAFREAQEWAADEPLSPGRTLTMRTLLSR